MGYDRFLKSHNSLRDARRTSKMKRRGGGGAFSDRYKPPQTDEGADPEEVIFFKGDYKMPIRVGKKGTAEDLEREYYLCFSHGVGQGRNFRSHVCSAGLKLIKVGDVMELTHGDDPCTSCYHIDNNAANISRRLSHVFNIMRPGYYHLVDSDETDDSGKPYKEWVECDGRRCKYCRDGIEKEYGRRRYWEMGQRFIDQLLTHAETVLANNCKCGGKLAIIGLECECGEVLYDFEEDDLDKKTRKKLTRTEAKCPHCGSVDIPVPVRDCDECNKPRPLEIWDVTYSLARTGTKTNTSLMIADWEPTDPDEIKKMKKRMKPYDFAKMLFKPPSLKDQASKMGVPNPFGDDEKRGGVQYDDEDDD